MKTLDHNHPRGLRIIRAAKELFWKYGFKRVSVEEICLKAQTSKMTFYRFFSNKTELAKAVFDKVVADGITQFREILADDSTPAEKVEKMIMMKIEGSHDVSQEFIMDFYSNPELGLKDYIETKTRETWLVIIDDFKKAQEKGTFRKDFKPELLLFFSQKASEIVTDKGLLQAYNNPGDLIKDYTNLVMYGIINR